MRFVVVVIALMLVPAAFAGDVKKQATENEPGVDPPKLDWTWSTPLDAVPSAVEGKVVARLLIDASGSVRKVEIVSSTDARLTNRTKQLMSGAKYIPASRQGTAVPVWRTETLQFVSAEAEIASVLACDSSKFQSGPPLDPSRDHAGLVLPVLLRNAAPEPTAEILGRGPGFSSLRCVIDVCGHVTDCKVIKSSGGEYDEPALAAARQHVYRPAKRDGVPVPVYFSLRFDFR